MSVRPQAGQVVGSEQTFEEQREQLYPPRVGREWHAQSVGTGSTIREGKPIIKREGLMIASSSAAAEPEEGVAGGVVALMSRSR